jgi:hypothetical protein
MMWGMTPRGFVADSEVPMGRKGAVSPPVLSRNASPLSFLASLRWPFSIKRTAMVSLFVMPNEAERDGLREMVGYDTNGDARDRMIVATADEAMENVGAIVACGVDEVIVNLPFIRSVDAVHAAADVLRAATS